MISRLSLFAALFICILGTSANAATLGELLGLADEVAVDVSDPGFSANDLSDLVAGRLNSNGASQSGATGTTPAASGCSRPAYSGCSQVPCGSGASGGSGNGVAGRPSMGGGFTSGSGQPLNITIITNIEINIDIDINRPTASRCACR